MKGDRNVEIIETKRHRLRRWQESDAASLYEYAKDPRVGPNAGWAPHASLAESQDVITIFQEANDGYAIVDKATERVIGSFGFHDRRPRWTRERYEGQSNGIE